MSDVDVLAGYVPGTWQLDVAHCEIGFSVRHLMVSKVRGTFNEFSGTILTAADPLGSSATLTVDLGSIDTRNADRDAHLRSTDFFDAASHPTMEYHTTAVRRSGDGFEVDQSDLTTPHQRCPSAAVDSQSTLSSLDSHSAHASSYAAPSSDARSSRTALWRTADLEANPSRSA